MTKENYTKSIVQLGILHNKYKLFSTDDFNIVPEKNIINILSDFPWLQEYYEYYQTQFDNTIPNNPNQKEARSKDLPFLGKEVLASGKADFIILFEGSLSEGDRLSISVLCHLWLTEEESIINKYCGKGKWWTHNNYLNVKNRLNINNEIINRSYITDAIRFGNKEDNKNLIWEEIELFKPKLVICIGNKAKDLVGMRHHDLPTKFHYVKFPKYHNDDTMYEELNKILDKI